MMLMIIAISLFLSLTGFYAGRLYEQRQLEKEWDSHTDALNKIILEQQKIHNEWVSIRETRKDMDRMAFELMSAMVKLESNLNNPN